MNRFTHARKTLRWWPLVTGAVMLILHLTIETHFVSYIGFPEEHSPFLLHWGFVVFSWVTLLLALFILPRWQSFVGLLLVCYVILSLGGR
jgi:hypothetical protein